MELINKYKSLPVQVKASLWYLVCSFFQKGISIITTPIFTRILSTSEYGLLGTWNSWMGIIAIIASLSLYQGVYGQGLIKFEEERSIFISSIQGLTMTLILFWTIIYIAFHDLWNNVLQFSSVQMILMLMTIWTTAVFNFWAAEQRVMFSYRPLVLTTVIVTLAKPIVGIIFVINATDKVTARIAGLVFVELISYSWMFISQMKKGRKFFSKRFWLYALGFSLPLIPHYLSQVILSSSDRIMIQRMVGSSEAGIYNLAYSISLIMTLFNTALMQTVAPWMYKKIKEKKGQDIAPIAYTTLTIIAFVNLFLILLGPEIVNIFAPNQYHEAIWIIPPVAMSVFFMYSYDLFAKFAFYYEKTKFIMLASVSGALLNLVLNYIFIKRFGYVAAGYTTLACYIVYCIAHYTFMKKVCRECADGVYPYETKKILMITIPFLTLGFIILFTYKFSILRYFLIGISATWLILCRKKIMITIQEVLQLKRKQVDALE